MSRITEVSHERAYELANELQNKETYEGQVCTVFSGTHPELGDVHITIPPMGNSLLAAADLTKLLPIVTQRLTL
ncbi:hypothetical protein IVB12_15380 [Bradyrhizobium sp. 179]|uniref:hypothetical protein n=1 Tax=Bradyrhizobium sp. 179 TaxID=2782648 RepID=UPI001FF759D0|nr:hypothetical protein [Bradyrhizobium sp. 179]MCK1543296.1 hypothetical protein [Bradyrhizobium sp. 179]